MPKRRHKSPDWFEVLPADVRVVRDYGPQPQPEHLRDARRGDIQMFSPKSASRLTRTARNACPALVSQFCLTYHNATPDGRTTKKHLRAWIKALERAVPGVGWLWILEFQTRGVPHYHVWLTCPFDEATWKRLGTAWNRIAEPDSPEHLWWHTEARTDPRTGKVQRSMLDWDMKGAGYLRKYMSKEAQKCVPAGFVGVGRFWGASAGLVPEPVTLDAAAIRDQLGPAAVVDLTRTVSKWVESRRRRGQSVAQKIAQDKGKKFRRLKLRPTARGHGGSAWLNNAAPAFWQLLQWVEEEEQRSRTP